MFLGTRTDSYPNEKIQNPHRHYCRDRNGGNKPEAVPEKVEKVEKSRALADEHGDQEVSVALCESDTFWLLHIPGRCVASDSTEAVAVEEANGRYRTLLKARQGSELYADVGIQTVNNILKAKEIQSVSEPCTAQHSQATGWEIHDALHSSQGEASQEVQSFSPAPPLSSCLSSCTQFCMIALHPVFSAGMLTLFLYVFLSTGLAGWFFDDWFNVGAVKVGIKVG